MKLRARLVVSAVVIATIMLATVVLIERLTRARIVQSAMVEVALTYLQSGERVRCESDPSAWSVGRALPLAPSPSRIPANAAAAPMELQLFAYNVALVSANPQAPHVTPAANRGLERVTRGGYEFDQLLVRMPWDEGPCAVILVRRVSHRSAALAGKAPPGLPPLWVPLLLFLVMTAGAVALAVGPLVRRLRRLTARVCSLAAADYHGEVTEMGRDEVAELSRAFDAAAGEIRAGLKRQERRELALREFLENTTHDVSTSLTVLMGHLSALRQLPALVAPTERQRLGFALDETHYIGSLINNLALSARLDAGDAQMSRSPIDLNEVVRRCAARIRPVAAEAGIALDFATPDTPTLVEADVTMVEQALGNLLFNAVRHNLRDRHAAIVLDVTKERFDLRVLDDGPGIPEAELSEVLTRYARGNAARTRAPSGRGLGLAIAKQVADGHGWKLQLAAAPSGGTEALLSGPLLRARQD
ncbi:MAG TPA: HAMP domain-containing sensor histidine kinase [Polyangiaceae bacterium]|nr:HAMP domain-containing sensor histidine kinase [Polyangiaceae bacterium]